MNMFRLGSLIRSLRSSEIFAVIPRSRFFYGGTDGESAAYHHARLFRKPLSAKFKSYLSNSVSLMGFVDRTVRVIDTEPDRFGVFTLLRVKDPRNPNRSFRISLGMWDAMARKCITHLKPNDLVLVSGRLVSSSNENSPALYLDYQVKVTEVNYVVAAPSHVLDSQISPKSETVARGGVEERKSDKIHLWQVFFANPSEWWDNRKSEKNARQPDFKHKDTGEALWLDSDKPVWVTRQLELLDQRKARKAEKGCYDEDLTRGGRLSEWV